MASIADIEQFLEQVFERSTTRLFRTRVQGVQLERRVERAMERARVGHGAQTTVPARYRVRLHPVDMEDVAPDRSAAQALAAQLADAALAFARAHAYHLPGRPSVALLADPSLQRGRVEVDTGEDLAATGAIPSVDRQAVARRSSGLGGSSAAGAASPVEPVSHAAAAPPVSRVAPTGPSRITAPAADAVSGTWTPDTGAAAHVPAPSGPSAPSDVADRPDEPDAYDPAPGGIRGDGTQTLVFRRPFPEAARAVVRVLAPDGRETAIEVDGRPLTLGRARDNVLVLSDPRVSRHHGRVQARQGALVYTDLASTNGSRVNGVQVDEIALGVGDRILLGDTVLVVESLPD
jgi:hypothetical protein